MPPAGKKLLVSGWRHTDCQQWLEAGQGWLLPHLLQCRQDRPFGCEVQTVSFPQAGARWQRHSQGHRALFTGASQGGIITSLMPKLTLDAGISDLLKRPVLVWAGHSRREIAQTCCCKVKPRP